MTIGKYNSTHVASVDPSAIQSSLNGERLIIGLDVAKRKEYAALGDDEDSVFGVIRFNHPGETEMFFNLIDKLNYTGVQMVVEPTGSYVDPLRYLAYERGWEVWKMAPKRVHDSKEVLDGVPSIHDPKAAHLLLWLHGQNFSRRWQQERQSRRRVKTLTSRLARLQIEWQKKLGCLEAQMARYWPEVLQVWKLKRATLLGVLKNFGGPQTLVEHETEVRAYMRKKGGPLLSDRKIDMVIDAAKKSQGVHPIPSELESLQNLARRTDQLRREIRGLKRKINNSIVQKEVLMLGREVGRPTSAIFWEQMGSFTNYDSPDGLIKAFGLNLTEKSSGKYSGPLHISKRGHSRARSALYFATWRKINSDPLFYAWHQNKVNRDGGEENAHKNISVIALMRKYLKGLWHMARGEEFDSTALFDVNKLGKQGAI